MSHIYYADILLNLSNQKLSKGELQITLSSNESAIMKCLIKRSEIIVSHEKLIEKCNLRSEDEDVISTAVERLKKVLKYIGSRVQIIFIKGVGYKICC